MSRSGVAYRWIEGYLKARDESSIPLEDGFKKENRVQELVNTFGCRQLRSGSDILIFTKFGDRSLSIRSFSLRMSKVNWLAIKRRNNTPTSILMRALNSREHFRESTHVQGIILRKASRVSGCLATSLREGILSRKAVSLDRKLIKQGEAHPPERRKSSLLAPGASKQVLYYTSMRLET